MAKEFQSLKGFLLLDGGELKGSFFHRSVVLICNHDANGAFGLVLSQPTENKIGEVVVQEDLPEKVKNQALSIGGPVQTNALTFLYSETFLEEVNTVLPNLALGTEIQKLIELGNSHHPTVQFRCFAGYAGWTGGQLEAEMLRKAWLTYPATVEHVFTTNPNNLWKEVLRQMGWQYRLLAEGPEDVSWN